MPNRMKALLAIGGLLMLSACASTIGPMTAELDRYSSAVELSTVPFYPQITDQCGPAALATILNVADVETNPEVLRSLIYIPERNGSLQMELLAATRRYYRIPYQIDPAVGALLGSLNAGRPVLVLQNLGTRITPVWHYAVVVGYLPDDGVFVLRSGDRERHLARSRQFLQSWERAEFWGIVALRAGEIPADADSDRYLSAVAALEAIGDSATAQSAYRAATLRWPDNSLAWLALGNASIANGDLNAARLAYETSLQTDSRNAIALNNLSHVYKKLGQHNDAMFAICSAMSVVDPGDPLIPHLRQTFSEFSAWDAQDRCIQ